MANSPKYALPEIERRWLVDATRLGPLDALPWHDIEDLYLDDSRLRLRQVTDVAGQRTYKLCKKYGRADGVEAITNLYLSEAEHRLLRELPGRWVRKRRHRLAGGAVDVYDDALMVFEVEFASLDEARAYHPPAFVLREVTDDPAYTGAALATDRR